MMIANKYAVYSVKTEYAYLQTRLRVRNSLRPDESLWSQLAAHQSLESFLQAGRQTTLKFWLGGIAHNTEATAIERILREHFRQYLSFIKHWLNEPWQPAFTWFSYLVDVVFIQYLLDKQPVYAWMQTDTHLKLILKQHDAVQDSPWGEENSAWQNWFKQWQGLWPELKRQEQAGMQELAELISDQANDLPVNLSKLTPFYQKSEKRLINLFKSHPYQPAAVFYHILLILLDLQRLRGELLMRSLFTKSS